MADEQTIDALADELKHLIIEHLNLEDIDPDSVENDAPLFGEALGLDSVDALELVMLMETNYGAKIESSEVGKKAFESLNTLAEFVTANRKK